VIAESPFGWSREFVKTGLNLPGSNGLVKKKKACFVFFQLGGKTFFRRKNESGSGAAGRSLVV
jgi:hypothetical protein